ncbi:MraY family glycosyltransferase [Nigerium massiliense]|uniref:MraY family glycosyltransferase n=1 Tax=Nigerium massiliense TaxID=1522317 RepID=UPI00058E973B|nr:MraY family glycosyltransferase [Nigerium massiliense]
MREYMLVMLVAVAVTLLGASVCRRFAYRFHAVALVRDRDVHTKPIPYFGGIAMLAGVVAAFVTAINLPWLGSFPLVGHDTLAVFAGSALICGVGTVDDLIELNALAKISGQVLAAGIVVAAGVKFYWIPLADRVITLDNAASILLAVFFILLCVNAINLMDGLDGLAAGVVGIGASAFFVYAYLLSYEQDLVRATTASLISVTTIGVCGGFLPHNIHRARMFMGDSGSMLLGFLLACSSISLTGQIDPSLVSPGGGVLISAYLPLVLPFAVMALPFADLILAYVRRTLAGRLWFQADKQHLHHRMLALGHSHRVAVLLLWLWSGVVAYGIVLIGITGAWWAYVAVAGGVALAAFLTWGPLRHRRTAPEGRR